MLVGVALSLAGVARTVGAQRAVDSHAGAPTPSFEDLLHLREFDELAVSPDGRWVAYTMSARFTAGTASAADHITLVDLHLGRTHAVPVSSPPHGLEWSPHGDTLAFLASSRGHAHVWLYVPADTLARPEEISISDSIGGELLAFAWNPTGNEIAYLASEPGMPSRGVAGAHPPARLILFHDTPGNLTGLTSPAFARDSIGAYVAVTSTRRGSARILARHLISSKGGPTIAWSHAGRLLVSGLPRNVSWGTQLATRPLYTVDARTGAIRHVLPQRLKRLHPAWSSSGQWIASLNYGQLRSGSRIPWTNTLRIDAPGDSAAAFTLRGETNGLYSTFPPLWSNKDRQIYIAAYDQATARLFVVDVAGDRWRAITPDTLSVSRYAVTPDGNTVLVVLESANQPQELYRLDPTTGALTKLTHEADAWPRMRLGHVEQVAWASGDSRFTVHGFLITPPDYDPRRRYPLIVVVHGGPGALFTNSFVDANFAPSYIPPQFFAATGYMVLMPNPRGDMGYGPAFQDAIQNDFGPGPFGDIDAGVSALVARGRVDSSAVGIAGSSYGGYLTAFAITQTRRFGAASINDGPADLISEYGQNYAIRSAAAEAFFGGPPWSERDAYMRQSPITYVDRVRTPVLMRYGGRSVTHDNIRQAYMLAQGFELYAGLRDNGVPVEFVLHPDQGHGITDWRLYQDWITRNLRWFDYWLRQKGTDPTLDVQ